MPAGLACEVAFQVGYHVDAAGVVVRSILPSAPTGTITWLGMVSPLSEVQVGAFGRAGPPVGVGDDPAAGGRAGRGQVQHDRGHPAGRDAVLARHSSGRPAALEERPADGISRDALVNRWRRLQAEPIR